MIYVECRADLTLVRSITSINRREIIHEFGKGNICQRLREKRHCKGLVDEDPWSVQPRYIQEARLKSDLAEQGIKVLLDEDNSNYLIILRPRLEEWVLQAAIEAGINISQYHLPDDGERFHTVINANLDKFERLLQNLKSSIRLRTLQRLLERE